ncbi:MAG: DUF1993 domain-containing protein [Enterovibrio sp.]
MDNKITQQFIRMLTHIDSCLEKATEHAVLKQFDQENFLSARLIVDMHPLSRQLKICAMSACAAVSCATHSAMPALNDEPKTMAEAQALIKQVLDYLNSKIDACYDNYATGEFLPPWTQDKKLVGKTCIYDFAIPNFFFHLNMIYAILRKEGVAIGKGDYLGKLDVVAI